MKQDFIATCVANYLSNNNIRFREEETTSDAYGNYKWGQHYFDVNASYDGMKAIADGYNKTVGNDVLHVAIVYREHGKSMWAVDDDYISSAIDAVKKPWVYGGGENSETHVVAFENIEDEEEFILGRADDMPEAEAKAYRTKITDKFNEIHEMMMIHDVLVYNGPDLDSWEIRDRYPTSWTEDTIDYKAVLLIDDDYDEDRLKNLSFLAEYLNGCWTEGGNDTCNFISEWCDYNGYEYCQDSKYEFDDVDFVYNENTRELMYLHEDGKFRVVDADMPELKECKNE